MAFPASEVVANNFLRWLRGWFRPPADGGRSLLNLLAWATALDQWQRYRKAAAVVAAELSPGSAILEVSPGWFGLDLFLPIEFLKAGRIVHTDFVPRPLRSVPRGGRLLASAPALPFRDGSFDCVAAFDVLEHLPPEDRAAFCGELRRVARRLVLVHSPLQGGDGTYRAADYDERFLRAYRQRYHREEASIAEHVHFGHPSPEEVRSHFPGATVVGTMSAEGWLRRCLVWKDPLRAFALAFRDHREGPPEDPPFYGGLLVWHASAG